MKYFIALALFASVALALPVDDKAAVITKYDSDNIGVGGYDFAYETSNGLSHNVQAQLKNAGQENQAVVVRGQYSYPGPDGVLYTVVYIADENGFQPQGAHLPKAQ